MHQQRQSAQALRVWSESERGDEQSGRVERDGAGAPGQRDTGASEADGGRQSETSVCGQGLQRARLRGGDQSARGQPAERQDRQAAVEVDESQSTERNPRRTTQRRAQCSGNELQEVAQASGEDLALHPMDA
jgi:hypothetical protein